MHSMLDRLLHALAQSKNQAADDVLLEALRLGNEREKRLVFDALLRRKSLGGFIGVIRLYEALPKSLQADVVKNVGVLHQALRECGRSDEIALRLSAMKLIAVGRQGKLAYVLSENLHASAELLSKAATEAMLALAGWAAAESSALQNSDDAGSKQVDEAQAEQARRSCEFLIEQRPEIEAAVARAIDVHRGRHGSELVRAALLLCDWPGSKTLAILQSTKHGGQSAMVRRLQQPPAAEHVGAFLLGASHGQLRSHFGNTFAHINDAPALDALLRKTHWLKDHAMAACMQHVCRGTWWDHTELARDIERRSADEAACIGEWIAVSGSEDVLQDERLDRLRRYAGESFGARLRLFRIAARRRQGASVELLRRFFEDPDERLVRMAAREIVRRRPIDFENMLIQLMTGAPDSVRRIISRAVGQAGFDHYWRKFDHLSRSTRKRAGQAMMKLLPDAAQRIRRRLLAGPIEHRLKAMQMAQELGLGEALREELLALCADSNPRIRSKAIAVAGVVSSVGANLLVDRLLNDADPRVRANTVEVLETRNDPSFMPLLAQRARGAPNRERANAIKALHRMHVGAANAALVNMLRDGRGEHRISALWALKQIGWWQLLGEVGRLAKEDENMRVRRYALSVLRGVAELAQASKSLGKTA